MIEIFSKENKLVKHITKLSSDKKYRYKTREFLIEGLRLVREAYITNASISYAFVTREFYEKNNEFVDHLASACKECYIISSALSKQISETKSPQGIFAVCSMDDNSLYKDDLKENGKYLILCSLQDPGNLGTIIRTADAFSIDALILSDDCVDIYSPKVIRSAMGSSFRVKTIISKKENMPDTIRALKNKGLRVYAATLSDDSQSLAEIEFSSGCAVCIGNEGNGLEEDIISNCSSSVIIPMNDKTESLNAGVASAIFMWEMFKSLK